MKQQSALPSYPFEVNGDFLKSSLADKLPAEREYEGRLLIRRSVIAQALATEDTLVSYIERALDEMNSAINEPTRTSIDLALQHSALRQTRTQFLFTDKKVAPILEESPIALRGVDTVYSHAS